MYKRQPHANYNGPDSFTFKVGDGVSTSSEAMVTITVLPVNDAPTATAQLVTGNEDATQTITLAGSDPEDDSLTYTFASNPSNGTASLTGNIVTYTPTLDYNGSDSFTFRVSDGSATSSAAMISITVAPVNDAPTLVPIGNQSVAEGVELQISLSALDMDGDALTYSVSDNPPGSLLTGTAFSWIPGLAADGNYPMTFTVIDGKGGTASETITISVGNTNQTPTATAGNMTVTEDVSETILLALSLIHI